MAPNKELDYLIVFFVTKVEREDPVAVVRVLEARSDGNKLFRKAVPN